MRIASYLYCALTSRLAELRTAEQRDRGDSPVPTAVIIMGLVFVATVVTGLALTKANSWMNAIPDAVNPGGD